MPDYIFQAVLKHPETKEVKKTKLKAVNITEAACQVDDFQTAPYICIEIKKISN